MIDRIKASSDEDENEINKTTNLNRHLNYQSNIMKSCPSCRLVHSYVWKWVSVDRIDSSDVLYDASGALMLNGFAAP